MSKNAKKIIAVTVLLVLVAAAALAYMAFGPKANAGSKIIEVTVIHGDESQKSFTIRSDAESLREALESEGLIEGEDGPYGIYILTVDGETADESQQQWWCITKGGETVTTGAEDTMIAHGDKYEITLKTGW